MLPSRSEKDPQWAAWMFRHEGKDQTLLLSRFSLQRSVGDSKSECRLDTVESYKLMGLR